MTIEADSEAVTGTIVEPDEPQYDDYWNFSLSKTFMLPDGKQWIEFVVMNEGQKSDYQRSTNKDIKVNRRSGDATLKNDVAEERHALLRAACVNWNMKKGKNFVAFSRNELTNWLIVANPAIVEELEVAIRKANPWLQGEMSVADIDEEIKRLNELREETAKREAGKDS